MRKNITQKQKRALGEIYESIKETGFPPTLADLKERLNVSSNQAVLNFLISLEKKGLIERVEKERKKAARNIKILRRGYQVLGKEKLIPAAGVTSAGPYVESFLDDFSNWMTLPGEILENEKIKHSENVFVLQVFGDSMINADIDDGDVLLIQKTDQFRSGDIVVARSDDGTTIKRFVAEPDGRAYLKPENPAYPTMTIYEDTYFDGRVILNLTKLEKSHEQ
ncbi:MAG: transcriptional repressor LexA [Candidatus Moranbacteria bacterium]|nr:transcriptional repressor LexA [Candidatus Moranbacteria bacterium]